MSTQTQELEALEARLRAAEERLNHAKSNSPPLRKDSQRRTPIEGVFSDQDKSRLQGPRSPLAHKNPLAAKDAAGAPPDTPSSHDSADYVVVERPRSAQPIDPERA